MVQNTREYSRALSPAAIRAAGVFMHRWLGLTVGTVFVIAGLTGSLLAYAPEITGMLFPAIDGPPPAGWQSQRAHVLGRAQAEHAAGDVELVRFPNESQGAYEIYLANETLEYRDAISGDIVLVRTPYSDVLSFSRELHTHLFMGHDGEQLLGWLGVAMLVLLATGLWLWWPRFGSWRMAFRRPRGRHVETQLYWWHKTAGVVSLATLFVVTLTGVAMVFYYPAQAILTGLFGGEAPVVPKSVPAAHAHAATDWNRVLAGLDETLPQGRTVFFYPPATAAEPLLFRKQMPAELHPNGRSFIAMTASGDVLFANDATRLAAGMRATHAIYPLHSGRTPSETWRFAVFLMGLAPLLFFVTGAWTWWLRRNRNGRGNAGSAAVS